MTANATLSHRPLRRFWGWGNADSTLDDQEQAAVVSMAARLGADFENRPVPQAEDFSLPDPRISPPASLADAFSPTTLDRLSHCSGKSFADCARMWLREPPMPPDWVAFPPNEQAVVDILDWAESSNVAVIPYGGGSSVCGGVETDVGDSYSAVVSLDMERMNKVLDVDPVSRAARIQAGVLGPELAAQLKEHQLTLRHFPQSFEFSTLGGWIVTRAGGHYATQYTHIDDFVESTRLVTPAGVLQTRRLPGSGAGPAPDRLVIGSEGTLGVLTEAWVRVQAPPVFRASAAIHFNNYFAAAHCVRALAQSGLNPSNCRLLDAAETVFAGVGDGRQSIIVLAFESADHPCDARMRRALELVSDFGGEYDVNAVGRSLSSEHADEHRSGAAGAWRNAFLRMPYWRDPLVGQGIILDTFETAVTWDRYEDFYDEIKADIGLAIKRVTGQDVQLSCRITHAYPDGVAPYFTFATRSADGSIASALAAWCDIKRAANEAVVSRGGTVTHHHAIGRDHRSGYDIEVDPLFRQILSAAKQVVDPNCVLNPGVLFQPPDRSLGNKGVLAGLRGT
jgi:alkyldihydroxyacetonephosphate synthase